MNSWIHKREIQYILSIKTGKIEFYTIFPRSKIMSIIEEDHEGLLRDFLDIVWLFADYFERVGIMYVFLDLPKTSREQIPSIEVIIEHEKLDSEDFHGYLESRDFYSSLTELKSLPDSVYLQDLYTPFFRINLCGNKGKSEKKILLNRKEHFDPVAKRIFFIGSKVSNPS